MGQSLSHSSGKPSRVPLTRAVGGPTPDSVIQPTIHYLPVLDFGTGSEGVFVDAKSNLLANEGAFSFREPKSKDIVEPGQVQDQPHGYHEMTNTHGLAKKSNTYDENGDLSELKPIRTTILRESHPLLHSASLDDISYVNLYSRHADQLTVSNYSSDNERSSSSSFNENKVYLKLGLSTRRSAEHIASLKPSSAYRSSLRSSSSCRTSIHSIYKKSRFKRGSMSSKSSNYSSLWSPTSEVTEDYRIALITNPHFCTYGCKDLTFKRKSHWIRHEHEHELPTKYTCLLHASEELESSPCPGKFCVSVMDFDHLAYFHDSLACFEKPSLSIERYQTDKAESLLDHLKERHGLEFDIFPDYWSSEFQRRWRCGFCGGTLKHWQERVDHISLHFTREGLTMENWKRDANISAHRRGTNGTALLASKRLSIVEESDPT